MQRSRRAPHCASKLLRLFAAGTALIFTIGCGGENGEPPAIPPMQVETITASVAPVKVQLTAVGTLLANESVELMPELPGRVGKIHFQEGQRVEQGALLIELDREKETAQLAQTRADLDLARQNAERARTLAGGKAISVQEVDQINSRVAYQQASLEYQEKRVADMLLHAPFAGVLGPRTISAGQFVEAGRSLVTLTDNSQMKVIYRVPERHLADLEPGQAVTIRVAASGDRTFPGHVDLIHPQVDESTRTIEVRALVPNPDGWLRPGMFARVETIVGERTSSVVVPETAVVPSLNGFSVYVVTNGLARQTYVKTGMRLPGQVEILEGIAAGNEIIVGGIQKIGDGSPVQPAKAANSQVADTPASSTSAAEGR